MWNSSGQRTTAYADSNALGDAAASSVVDQEPARWEKVAFDQLLPEVSARFINLRADRIDDEINDVLKRVAELLDLDRSTIAQFSMDGRVSRRTHYYHLPDIAPPPPEIPHEVVPWYAQEILAGRTVVLHRMPDDLPPTAQRERELAAREGIRSNLVVPMRIGTEVIGGLGFACHRDFRTWTPSLIRSLQMLGDVFANALARKRADAALQDQFNFQRFLAEVSARFITTPAAAVDAEIEATLARMAEYLGAGRLSVGLFSADGQTVLNSHNYVATDAQPGPEHVIPTRNLIWLTGRLRAGHVVKCSMAPGDLPPEAAQEMRYCQDHAVRSFISVPLRVGEETLGHLTSGWVRDYRNVDDELTRAMQLFGETFANALERKRAAEAMAAAMADIRELKDRLQAENVYLREEIQHRDDFQEILGDSAGIRKILRLVEQVAGTESTVLIQGETGTGKELIARAIHERSSRRERVMIKLNCAALPATLVEAELFGREKGAYTGALARQLGRFELADGSTLFLDEVGELPPEIQVKLLRVLQEGQFERLGSGKTINVNVRIVAATNRDLAEAVADGSFRRDLYYRLNVFPIVVPPLRERREDIPQLVWAFVNEFCGRIGKSVTAIPKKTMQALEEHPWPGNVRELRNVIERAMILCQGSTLHVTLPEPNFPEQTDGEATLDDVQRRRILQVLEQTNYRIRGPRGAAELLGLKPTTLESRMAKLGINRPHNSE